MRRSGGIAAGWSRGCQCGAGSGGRSARRRSKAAHRRLGRGRTCLHAGRSARRLSSRHAAARARPHARARHHHRRRAGLAAAVRRRRHPGVAARGPSVAALGRADGHSGLGGRCDALRLARGAHAPCACLAGSHGTMVADPVDPRRVSARAGRARRLLSHQLGRRPDWQSAARCAAILQCAEGCWWARRPPARAAFCHAH